MPCQRIGCIYTAMLSACTTETDHKTFKISFQIIFNSYINNIKNTVEEFRHFGLLFQKIFYRFITTGLRFKFFNSSRVQNPAAIKNKPAAITAAIFEQSFFIRKTIDLNRQWSFFSCLQRSELLNDLIIYANVKHSF